MNFFLDKEILKVLLMEHEVRTVEQEKTLQIFLLQIPFIQRLYSKRQNLETTEVLQLFSQVSIIQKSKGSIIYHQDEIPLGLYIIVQGTIASLVMKPNSQIERERATFNPKKRYFGQLLYKMQKKLQKKKIVKDPSKKKDKKEKKKKENKQDVDDVIDEIRPMKFTELEQPFKMFDLFGVFLFNKIGEVIPFTEFGESSLVERTYRNSSAICLTDCILLEVSKDLYNQILLWEQQQKLMRKMAFFRRALRVQISDKMLISFCNSFQKVLYQKGNTVYAQEDVVQFVYLIKKGEVQMTHLSNQIAAEITDLDRLYSKQCLTKKTTEVLLGIFGPAQFFGVSEAIRCCRRETGAKALSAVTSIYQISIQEFNLQLDQSQRLAQAFNIYKISLFGADAAQKSQTPQKLLKDLLELHTQPDYVKKNQYIKIQKNWMPFTTMIKNKNTVFSKLHSSNCDEKIIFFQDFLPPKPKKLILMQQDKNYHYKLDSSVKAKKSSLVQVIENRLKNSEQVPFDEYSMYRNEILQSQQINFKDKNQSSIQQRRNLRAKSVQRPKTVQKSFEVNGLNISTIQVEDKYIDFLIKKKRFDILSKKNIPKSMSLPQTQKKIGQVLHSKEEMFKLFPDLTIKGSTKNSLNGSQNLYRRIQNRELIK